MVEECCFENVELNMMQNGSAAHPTYVTLIAKDETVFMARRDALIKASFFFEKRLKSGVDESGEGIIRLHAISAALMEIILKFIDNGRAQINNVENAKGLIAAADYLLLPSLKNICEQFLEKRLCISNCISIFYFAKEYRCNELVAKVHSYVESNFTNVAQSKEFLDLSSQEIENWISSDEIVINNEEEIFEIIVQWMSQKKRHTMEEFKELFRHVRLMFVSRDYLTSSIATNSLVKEDAKCLDCVTQALRWLDGRVDSDFPWQQLPRKSLQSHVIVACRQKKVLYHSPGEDKWQKLPDVQSESVNLVSCRGKLFAIAQELKKSQRYEPLLNEWVSLTTTEWSVKPQVRTDSQRRHEQQVFAVEGEIYVTESDQIGSETITRKYDFNSNSWKSFPAFGLGQKDQVCIVPAKQLIYAIGGRKRENSSEGYVQKSADILSDVGRFDIKQNIWEKLQNMHEARRRAFGSAKQDKIFIAGGIGSDCSVLRSCELYKIPLNEWEFIASVNVPRMLGSMVCVSEKLYVLGGLGEPCTSENEKFTVECYDDVNGDWKKTTIMTFEKISEGSTFISVSGCSAQLFNGVSNNINYDSLTVESSRAAKTKSSGSRLCCLM